MRYYWSEKTGNWMPVRYPGSIADLIDYEIETGNFPYAGSLWDEVVSRIPDLHNKQVVSVDVPMDVKLLADAVIDQTDSGICGDFGAMKISDVKKAFENCLVASRAGGKFANIQEMFTASRASRVSLNMAEADLDSLKPPSLWEKIKRILFQKILVSWLQIIGFFIGVFIGQGIGFLIYRLVTR